MRRHGREEVTGSFAAFDTCRGADIGLLSDSSTAYPRVYCGKNACDVNGVEPVVFRGLVILGSNDT